MKPTTTLAGLVLANTLTAAHAVNILSYIYDNCQGSYTLCTNIPSHACCNGGAYRTTRTGAFYGLPADSTAYAFDDDNGEGLCGEIVTQASGVSGHLCTPNRARNLTYTGYGWTEKGSLKRATGSPCSETREFDMLVLADGTEYHLEGMTQHEKLALWDRALNEGPFGQSEKSVWDWQNM